MTESANPTPRHDDAAETFSARGLRCTRQREAIYAALRDTDTHPTADEIYRGVKPVLPGMSLATVYNTLELLCKHGMVTKLPAAEGQTCARYDADLTPHIHARCVHTGRVYDVPAELSTRLREAIPAGLLAELEAAIGVRVADVHLEVLAESTDAPPPRRVR